MKRIFLVITVLMLTTASRAQIRNTTSLINYILTAENMKSYFTLKKEVDSLAKVVKYGTLTTEQKQTLKNVYNDIHIQSLSLYDKIQADILSKETRNYIYRNVTSYTSQLSERFSAVNNSIERFNNEYKRITGSEKGILQIIRFAINFFWDVARSFVRESLGMAARNLLETQLKPKIIVPSWDQL